MRWRKKWRKYPSRKRLKLPRKDENLLSNLNSNHFTTLELLDNINTKTLEKLYVSDKSTNTQYKRIKEPSCKSACIILPNSAHAAVMALNIPDYNVYTDAYETVHPHLVEQQAQHFTNGRADQKPTNFVLTGLHAIDPASRFSARR